MRQLLFAALLLLALPAIHAQQINAEQLSALTGAWTGSFTDYSAMETSKQSVDLMVDKTAKGLALDFEYQEEQARNLVDQAKWELLKEEGFFFMDGKQTVVAFKEEVGGYEWKLILEKTKKGLTTRQVVHFTTKQLFITTLTKTAKASDFAKQSQYYFVRG